MHPILPCPSLHRAPSRSGEAELIARRIASRRRWARRRRWLTLRAALFGRRPRQAAAVTKTLAPAGLSAGPAL